MGADVVEGMMEWSFTGAVKPPGKLRCGWDGESLRLQPGDLISPNRSGGGLGRKKGQKALWRAWKMRLVLLMLYNAVRLTL